jgi:hypothetical protein
MESYKKLKSTDDSDVYGMANHIGNLHYQMGNYRDANTFFEFAMDPKSGVKDSARKMQERCIPFL